VSSVKTCDRPNIFILYEQNIGLLTPPIADELRQAEQTYPAGWIEEAFREAVSLNKRSWRYIRAILTLKVPQNIEMIRREDSGRFRLSLLIE